MFIICPLMTSLIWPHMPLWVGFLEERKRKEGEHRIAKVRLQVVRSGFSGWIRIRTRTHFCIDPNKCSGSYYQSGPELGSKPFSLSWRCQRIRETFTTLHLQQFFAMDRCIRCLPWKGIVHSSQTSKHIWSLRCWSGYRYIDNCLSPFPYCTSVSGNLVTCNFQKKKKQLLHNLVQSEIEGHSKCNLWQNLV